MNGLLLDACTLIWASVEPDRLSPAARAALGDETLPCHLSVVTLWEIAAKHRAGKLLLPQPPRVWCRAAIARLALSVAPLTEAAPYLLETLPSHHRDPFDRMLICQAIAQGWHICTPDAEIVKYPVNICW